MADDLGERTEAPTGRRLSEARGKGQVPKSQDFGSAVTLIGDVVLLSIFGAGMAQVFVVVMRSALSADPGETMDATALWPAFRWSLAQAAIGAAPMLALVVALGVLAQVLQVGWLVTLEPVKPKLTSLSPMKGLKRIFGKRGLVKSGIGILKMSVVGWVAWLVLSRQAVSLANLPGMEAVAAVRTILGLAFELAIWLTLVLLVIALIDLAYQKWQHKQDLKMTKQEVKDERRMMEGSPEVKKRRLQMAMDIAMHRIQHAVPKADVVVTNPTHFAVALKYDSKSMRAPRVLAKGADLMAFRIRHVAMATGVQIVERPPLARALYWGVEVGREVSPEHYEAVAEVLAFVYRLKGKKVA
ncbi:MAG: flagellar biosynthesis protein FlhB [Phycisphaerales bacterium]|nr:flagellar biosynthesis protein FlhB [Phycisphaerales bacterium]MCB9840984.1 flagellar biosynthesis protein FlhB [Phycisphaeraceae bacterium]